jgi:hypothetical protein
MPPNTAMIQRRHREYPMRTRQANKENRKIRIWIVPKKRHELGITK